MDLDVQVTLGHTLTGKIPGSSPSLCDKQDHGTAEWTSLRNVGNIILLGTVALTKAPGEGF